MLFAALGNVQRRMEEEMYKICKKRKKEGIEEIELILPSKEEMNRLREEIKKEMEKDMELMLPSEEEMDMFREKMKKGMEEKKKKELEERMKAVGSMRIMLDKGWKKFIKGYGDVEILKKKDGGTTKYAIQLDESNTVHKKIKKGIKYKYDSEIFVRDLDMSLHPVFSEYRIAINGGNINDDELVRVRGMDNAKKIVEAGNKGNVEFFGTKEFDIQ